ncbi:PLDc N-terminal domain-containing protein [Dyadobacter jiangsuensis]|uniref:Phospholipase D-like protein n=1 Tax=Dyadobacter jiangsuensis TaxID=1591085 RepID=A0A2P8FP80_9BACT|nr:PLD nuclease N-terminal domain-containing protein [Dyadobacter jiangsuensis]PSL23541.1 phospholipase D-like protein [Dyadobacter jiangsuensis]
MNLLAFLGLGQMELILVSAMLLPMLLTLWALIDAIRSEFVKDINKLIWILVILCLPLAGGILYFLLARKQKVAA